MSDLILRSWNDKAIRQRADGFISATDMCEAGGKLFGNWYRLDSTKVYLKAVQDKYYPDLDNGHENSAEPLKTPRRPRCSDLNNGPVEIIQGGNPENQGTWVDRRVALRLAQWISPAFALQVDEWIEELLTKGTVSIAPEPAPQPKQIPATSLKEWIEIIAGFPALANSPIVISALQARVAEEVSGATGSRPADHPVILTVRANQLGCSHAAIGNGTQLGKRIVALGFEPVGKEQHGRYPVNVYVPSPELDSAILEFCGERSQLIQSGKLHVV